MNMDGHSEASVDMPGSAIASKEPGVLIEALAQLPEKAMVDEARLAHLLQVSPRTVRRMVARFELPHPVTFGGRAVWVIGRILAHIETNAEAAEKEAKRQHDRIQQYEA